MLCDMRFLTVVLGMFLSISAVNLRAQHSVDPTQRYHRLICLVHYTGAGTKEDPKRPEYVPGPADARDRSGIVAWSATPADDGNHVIIQVVAVDRNAFAAILADTRPDVKVFEIGKDPRGVIEAFMQQHKNGFTLDSLKAVAQ